jgi:hypothetical protein
MTALQPTLSVFDWIALGFLFSLLSLIALGIYRLRQEIRETARLENGRNDGATPTLAQKRR